MTYVVLQFVLATLLPVVTSAVLFIVDRDKGLSRRVPRMWQLLVGIVFGIVAILGTELGIETSEAIMNVRDAAPLVAGLVFGGPAGIIAGLIGGVERWCAALWGRGMFTRDACSAATVLAGLYAALLRKYLFEGKRATWQIATAVGLVNEVLHLTLIFLTNLDQAARAYRVAQACAVPMITCNAISTGLYNDKQPYNESRSGEYMIIYTKTGVLIDGNMHCDYALRFNAADYLHEVPYIVQNGQKNYKGYEAKLGSRASHGCLRVQRLKNSQGYNMRRIAELVKKRKDKNCVKLVVWEDYQGRQVRIPDDDTPLYYNPKKGTQYHAVADCASVRQKFRPLTAFTFGELEEDGFKKLNACPYCVPTPRKAALEEINEVHLESSPGEVMNYWPGEK